ncbi:AMP-binding protein [Nocardia concava]|uniref:AMP-binding protein n=1 Tax=Nocardia concava TaxID=257281 RepID=UPI0002DCD05E|nr:AMP-binding protein [Nocardia concava]
MTIRLLDWLDDPSPKTGLNWAVSGGWRRTTYEQLATRVKAHAAALHEHGVSHGSVVSIIEPSVDEFVVRFFAVLLAGATPNPIAPPFPIQDEASYRRQLGRLLDVAQPTAISVAAHLWSTVAPVVTKAITVLTDENATPAATFPGCAAEDIALLQFTSGSSGIPKAVRVPTRALEANIADIHAWLLMTPADRMATWLPPYHDMGLIGGLLASIAARCEVDAMAPIDFIRDPAKWLSCVGQRGATISPAPNFALSYVVDRVGDDQLSGLDFSGWKALVCGAERVDPLIARRFVERLRPYGFRSETFCPAYGMAEATLAVSGDTPGRQPRVIAVDRTSGALDGPFELMVAPIEDGRSWLVSCGEPLSTVEVSIADDSTGCGELHVSGPSLALDYRTARSEIELARDSRGRLATGDAGYLVDGEVYPIGRMGDSVKIRGVAMYAEDLEIDIVRATGLASNRVAVLAGVDDGRTRIAAVVEDIDVDPALVTKVLTAATGGDVDIVVLAAARGTVERTTSGKTRRRQMWRKFAAGEYKSYQSEN